MRSGKERVEELVVRRKAHDGDGGEEVRELGLESVHGLVEDDGSIGIVDTSITADYKLRCFETGVVFV